MIDKKEKIQRLKNRLYQCYMQTSLIDWTNYDVIMFNTLGEERHNEDNK